MRTLFVSFSCLLAVVGCFQQQTARPQIGDEPAEKDAMVRVGDRTDVSNVEPVQVHGVGLVINLNNTGSAAPPGEFRIEMERALRAKKLNPKELLDDPARTTSLVTLTAMIPSGARAGDPVIVSIALPPNSKTSSLKGGYLAVGELYTFESANNIRASLNTAGMSSEKKSGVDGAVRGERIKEKAFKLHRVAPTSPGLIHITTHDRAEIVSFGDGGKLTGPFTLPVGSDFTITANADNTEVTLNRVVRVNDTAALAQQKCRPDLVAVLQMLAELGGSYGDAIEFIRRADRAKVLGGSVMYDATPPGLPTQELARLSRIDPTLEKSNGEALRIGAAALDVSTTSHDLPNEADQIKPPTEKSGLNRDPGRIFGPKKSDDLEVSGSALPTAGESK